MFMTYYHNKEKYRVSLENKKNNMLLRQVIFEKHLNY